MKNFKLKEVSKKFYFNKIDAFPLQLIENVDSWSVQVKAPLYPLFIFKESEKGSL